MKGAYYDGHVTSAGNSWDNSPLAATKPRDYTYLSVGLHVNKMDLFATQHCKSWDFKRWLEKVSPRFSLFGHQNIQHRCIKVIIVVPFYLILFPCKVYVFSRHRLISRYSTKSGERESRPFLEELGSYVPVFICTNCLICTNRFLVIYALYTAGTPAHVHGQESSTSWSLTVYRRKKESNHHIISSDVLVDFHAFSLAQSAVKLQKRQQSLQTANRN